MTSGVTVEFAGLTKRFGSLTAVDDLSFTVAPGQVTGFLGPNGAGKTTTMRAVLGLVRPTSGTATVLGDIGGPHETGARVTLAPPTLCTPSVRRAFPRF